MAPISVTSVDATMPLFNISHRRIKNYIASAGVIVAPLSGVVPAGGGGTGIRNDVISRLNNPIATLVNYASVALQGKCGRWK